MVKDIGFLKELHSRHLSSSLRLNYCLVGGKGNSVEDISGRDFLDLTGGNGESILGYGHPKLIAAIVEQSQKLLCAGDSVYNELAAVLAGELVEETVFDKVCFFSCGASTLLNAFKLLKNYFDSKKTGKKILVVADSLSSISFGAALEIEEYSKLVEFTPQNDFESFRKKLTNDIGAVLIETFQPECGLSITKHDFLLNAYTHCKTKGVLLIMNELISGMGRTGHVFSYDYSGIKPDIVLISKGLGGGMPLGAMLSRGEIAYSISKEKNSFSASYLPSLAAALVVVRELKSGLIERVVDLGGYFKAKLFKLAKFEFVKEIRGTGLILGLELDAKIDTHDIIIKLAKEGILASISIKNTIVFLPPYTITRKEIDKTLDTMERILSEIY